MGIAAQSLPSASVVLRQTAGGDELAFQGEPSPPPPPPGKHGYSHCRTCNWRHEPSGTIGGMFCHRTKELEGTQGNGNSSGYDNPRLLHAARTHRSFPE